MNKKQRKAFEASVRCNVPPSCADFRRDSSGKYSDSNVAIMETIYCNALSVCDELVNTVDLVLQKTPYTTGAECRYCGEGSHADDCVFIRARNAILEFKDKK